MLVRELFLITTVAAAASAVPVANPQGGYPVTGGSSADPQIETANLAYALGGATIPSSDVATNPNIPATSSRFDSQHIITDTYNMAIPDVSSSAEVTSENNDEKCGECSKTSSPAAWEANNDKTCGEDRCMDRSSTDPLSDKASGDDCGSADPASASEPITPDEPQTDSGKGCNKCKDADNQYTVEPAGDIPYAKVPKNVALDDPASADEVTEPITPDAPDRNSAEGCDESKPTDAQSADYDYSDIPQTESDEDCDRCATPGVEDNTDPAGDIPFTEVPGVDDDEDCDKCATTVVEDNTDPAGDIPFTEVPGVDDDEDCDRCATPGVEDNTDPAGDIPFTEEPVVDDDEDCDKCATPGVEDNTDPAGDIPFTEVPGVDDDEDCDRCANPGVEDNTDPAGDIPGMSETPWDETPLEADPATGTGFPYPDLPRTTADIPFADMPGNADGPSTWPAKFSPGSGFPNTNIPFTPESETISEGCVDATSTVTPSDVPFSELPGSNQPVGFGDGRCSAESPCPDPTHCCSEYGYCGTTVEYCNADSITLPSFRAGNRTRIPGSPIVTNVCEPQPISASDDCPCRGDPESQTFDDGQFDPAIPTDGQFDPAIPTDGQFDPAIPTNDQFNPATPTNEFSSGGFPPEGFPEEFVPQEDDTTVNDLPGSGPFPPQTESSEDCNKCADVDTQVTTGPAGENPSAEMDDPAAEVPNDVAVDDPAFTDDVNDPSSYGPQTEGDEDCNCSGSEAADPVDSIPSAVVPDESDVPEDLTAPVNEAPPTGDSGQSDPAPAGENFEPGYSIPQTESEEGCDKCADASTATNPAGDIPFTDVPCDGGTDESAGTATDGPTTTNEEATTDPDPFGENTEPASGMPQTESEKECNKCADAMSTYGASEPAGVAPGIADAALDPEGPCE